MMAMAKAKTAAAVIVALCLVGGAGTWLAANTGDGGASTATYSTRTVHVDANADTPTSNLGPTAVAQNAPAPSPTPPARAAQPAAPTARNDAGPDKPDDLKDLMARPLPEVKFDGAPLNAVIDFLRDVSGANIVVNWRALERAGVERNATVDVRLKNVRFDKALESVLTSAGGGARLVFTVDGGVITIDAPAPGRGAAAAQPAASYDVKDLLAPRLGQYPGGPEGRKERENILLKLVTGSVAPTSWKDQGGPGEARVQDGKLEVSTTPENRKAIENLLEQVRRLTGADKDPNRVQAGQQRH